MLELRKVTIATLRSNAQSRRHRPRRQFQIHGDPILNVDFDRARDSFLEAWFFDYKRVAADPERTDDVLSGLVGGDDHSRTAIGVSHSHPGSANHRPGLVADKAYNRSGILLGPRRSGKPDQQCE
jgi:hypothetical protein